MERNVGFDILKCICAFLVVCIHAPLGSGFGGDIKALARIAVPIFFMISGFFFQIGTAQKQIKKLLLLLFTANGIYFIWKVSLAASKKQICNFFSVTFTVKNFLKFLILNETHLQSHLWYLGAILYVVIVITIIHIINKKKACKFLYAVTPLLLLGDLMLGKYSLLLFHREFPVILARNWLFVGIPYFSIGLRIRECCKDTEVNEIFFRKHILLILIILSILSSVFERYCLESIGMNAKRDHYFSTTVLAVSVFLFFLTYVKSEESWLSRIGKNDTTWIYILHPILISVFEVNAGKTGIWQVYNYIRPIFVFLVITIIVDSAMNIRCLIKSGK